MVDYLADYYARLDGVEVLLAEQGADLGDAMEDGVRRIRVPNPGPFNPAWGWNLAARRAKAPVLVFAEAHTLAPPLAIAKAGTVCLSQAEAVNLFTHFAELGRVETEALIDGRATPGFERPQSTSVSGFCDGGFGIHAERFRFLGGFDERLRHPAELAALMGLKLERAGGVLGSFDRVTALRLDTDSPKPPRDSPLFERLQADLHKPAGAFGFYCEVQRQLMGNPEKYLRTQ